MFFIFFRKEDSLALLRNFQLQDCWRRENEVKRNTSAGPQIKVIGVGGGGSNAIAHMVKAGISGVAFVALDTDTHKLRVCPAEHKLAIGQSVTHGAGTGGDAEQGREAAEQSHKEIQAILDSTDLVFVATALGGGTGTGAAPVVAEMAKNAGILTIGVVTTPFEFERQRRMQTAQMGLEALRERVDALMVIHNQRLFQLVDRRTPLREAFALADDILRQAVQGVSELITIPGTINVDFADVRTVLKDAGPVLMGTCTGPVDRPAADLVQAAVSSPLLENGIRGANDILLNVSIGNDASLHQVYEIADAVAEATGTGSPNVIFGTVVSDQLRGKIRLMIIASRFQEPPPVQRLQESIATQPFRVPRETSGAASSPPPPLVSPAVEEDTQPLADSPAPSSPVAVDLDDIEMPAFIRRPRKPKTASQVAVGNGQKDGQGHRPSGEKET